MTKPSFKSQVHHVLTNTAAGWLTIEQIMNRLPGVCEATVSRSLRKLRAAGQAVPRPMPGNKRFREWTCVTSSTSSVGPGPSILTNTPSHRSPMLTFKAAIETIITDNITAQKTFSAFDVTKTLREKVNAGTAAIDPADVTAKVHVNSKLVARIDHDEVKAFVHDLFTQGKMTGYDRSNNGQYWQYGPTATSPTPQAAPSSSGGGTPPAVSGASYDGGSTL